MLTLLLAASMAMLLLTSLAISQSLFTFLPQPGLFTMREVHWVSAYWVMAPFFGHWLTVVGPFAVIGHLTTLLANRIKSARKS